MGVTALWRDSSATKAGAVYGVVAFAVGFVATFVLERDETAGTPEFVAGIADAVGPTLGELVRRAAAWLQPDPLHAVAWFYYASHSIPLEVSARAFGASMERTVDLRATPLWDSVLVVVPPVVLLAAGLLFARRQGVGDAESSVLAGVRVALGYGTVAVAGVYAVTYTRDVGVAAVTIRPELTAAALYGYGYPVVFGTAGALAYAAFLHSTPEETTPGPGGE